MAAIERVQDLTLEEFSRLYDQEGPFEIIDGERLPKMPNIARHSLMIRMLFVLLYQHSIANALGEVFNETTFVLTHGSSWVKGSRIPDLMFFSAEKWAQYTAATEGWEDKPFVLLPDLVIEVVSPNDLYSDIQSRVNRYLGDGIRKVWVVDPRRKQVMVYDGSGHYSTLGMADTLTGNDVLPGFTVALNELFK